VALLARAAHPLHPHGGMERAVYHLAKHLRALGAEPVLFTRPATGPGEFPGEVITLRYASVRAGAHGRVLDRSLNYPGFVSRVGRAVAEEVRGGRIHVVDAQGLTALGYGRMRQEDRGGLLAPLVMNPQGMEEHKTTGLKRLALTRLRTLSREAARLADRVVATDEATRAETLRLLGVDPSRVVVLPNGIDPEEMSAATPQDPRGFVDARLPALGAATPVFLSVGRLESYKGFADVLRALLLLHARGELPPGWAWVVAGEGPDRDAIARQARDAGIAARVHLLGRVGEDLLHALYARTDLFVHATRYEGSSLVTLEAMAHSLPVCATRAGGIPDKVVEGETGRLVEPGDVEGLARAIAVLAGDPGERARMGRAGRERALSLFAWPKLARRTLALYEQLLVERRS
jgi:glycosyltransferase involved in cell wall biosynthesis